MIREIQNMLAEGISGRKIAATMHISRDSVRKYATGNPEYLAEKGNHAFIGLIPFQDEIISLIKQGYTRKDVCRTMSLIGYDGKLTQFYEYCRSLEEKGFIPSPVQLKQNQLFDLGRNKKYRYLTRSFLFRFLWSKQGEVSERDWEILCTRYPILETVKILISEFRNLFNNRSRHDLETFLEKYKKSVFKPIRAFAESLIKDFIPVSNAITFTYSNGFVEGNNNKLKMIKRLSYGRCSLQLLKAKLLLPNIFLPSNTQI
jgi:hypothetical protein